MRRGDKAISGEVVGLGDCPVECSHD
jgi:hypothetical protein